MPTIDVAFTEQQMILIRRLAEKAGTSPSEAVAGLVDRSVADDLLLTKGRA